MKLLQPVALARREAPNRIVFGPHVTNLGDDRRLSDRHVAYYGRRARGGAGVVVVEEASVHPSDWPYERSPLASQCGPGWTAIAGTCQAHGSLVLAGLGHAGGQGTSHWSQLPLWAPSDEPEVNTREVPKVMEQHEIDAVVQGFGAATELAMASGLDGVELNAGQHSLIRQFMSGLTNRRGDDYGSDRMRFVVEVIGAARIHIGSGILGLRLSCDEMAPWAGITPESAAEIVGQLAPLVDFITVVRGSIFSVQETRPDTHQPAGFNLDLVRTIRDAAGGVPVVAQGSIVDVGQAEWALGDGRCDLVEMTRAQIADPDLAGKAADGADTIRPCVRCNQMCQVRDNRNPIVSCIVNPTAGHENSEDRPLHVTAVARSILVVGGGVAGMEAARLAAEQGHAVELVERAPELGGMVNVAAAGSARESLADFPTWQARELTRLGVQVTLGKAVTAADLAAHDGPVVIATGSVSGDVEYQVAEDACRIVTAPELLAAARSGNLDELVTAGDRVVVLDPIGGPIGVSIAELLGGMGISVSIVTQDNFAGQMLSLTGDLAPCNVRLAQLGVDVVKRSLTRAVNAAGVVVEQRFDGTETVLEAALVVDAGPRLPDNDLWAESVGDWPRIGDAVAPRTIHEAVLEATRVVAQMDAAWVVGS